MAHHSGSNDSDDTLETILTVAVGVGLLAFFLAPGFVSATVGGALTGAGGYLLKKGFGR